MLFALSFNESLGYVMVITCGLLYLAKKALDSNPNVKDAAYQAGSAKLIELIRRWLK